jgi:antitoxin HigA-1
MHAAPTWFSASYLGDLAVPTAAAHLRITPVALSRPQRQGRDLRRTWPSGWGRLGTTTDLWMNMQSQYDLWRARQGRQPAVVDFHTLHPQHDQS